MPVIRVKHLASFQQAAKGLLGTHKPYGVFFTTRFGIHTFFMNYPIDVLILDGKNRIAAIKKNLAPNRIFIWNPNYNKVVELPAGTIEKHRLSKGVKIKLRLDPYFGKNK